jgi:apolipoprotein N-acyltransferase
MEFLRKQRLVLLSILSGVLFAISWPAAGIPMLIFIAFIPLLVVEDHIFTHREQYSRYAVLIYAWVAFAVFNILTTWWIMFASLAGLMMAVVLNSLFMAIAFFLMHVSRRVLPGKQGVAGLVIFWMSFEYLHLDWELSWSWLNLGNVFAAMPRWVQWYEYTGVLGGTAWVLIMNVCFYILYRAYVTPLETITIGRNIETLHGSEKQKMEVYLKNVEQYRLVKRRFFAGLTALVFLLVPTIISFVIYSRYILPEDPVEVVLVQDARDPYLRPPGAAGIKQWTDADIDLAQEAITPQTRFVLLAEGSLPGALWLNNPPAHYGYKALMEHTAAYDSLAWIAGVMMYRNYAQGEAPSATARKADEDNSWYDFYNAALYIDSQGNTSTYFKSKLVPGIERMPFAQYLRPVGALVELFGGTSGSMGVQAQREIFTGTDGTRVAPVICYESVYGYYVNEYIRQGAQVIFIITNDGWWRNTPGHRQHHQYARLRAIETRRSIARAAKTGISGFIDPLGNIIQQSAWNERTALRGIIHKNNEITFYVRNGEFLGRLSMFLMILLLVYMFAQQMIRKRVMSYKS